MPNKAVAAGVTSGLSGALATLVIAIWWPDCTPVAAAALTTVMGVPAAFIGAFMAKFEGGAS